jgi:DNA-binding transcriptional LysR family regulator
VAPALAPLLDEAPQLRLRLLVDDAMMALIDQRIDVAVRVGRLADSNWVARRLCDFDMILCASPDYVARRGLPATPQQLPSHQWLAFAREGPVDGAHDGFAAPGNATLPSVAKGAGKGAQVVPQGATMPLDMHAAAGERHRIQVPARIACNNQLALQQMCEHGLGIARLSHADVASAIARGTLVRVLPQWRFAAMPVWAVTPRREESEAAKVRGAVGCLRRHFTALPALAGQASDQRTA